MPKVATRYLEVDPWAIVERGFHPQRARVSESIFSLANEYMGVRGYFEEGTSGDHLVGSYLNGVYEETANLYPAAFKGMSERCCFMVNTLDWLYTRIRVDGEDLDLAKSRVSGFVRRLDMRAGTLEREFTWRTKSGKELRLSFLRFLSMVEPNFGCQRITMRALNFSGTVHFRMGLDFSPIQETENRNLWKCLRKGRQGHRMGILAGLERSRHRVFSSFVLDSKTPLKTRPVEGEKFVGVDFSLQVKEGETASVDRLAVNLAEKNPSRADKAVWAEGMSLGRRLTAKSFDEALAGHCDYWRKVWQDVDITIDGDPENQQGVRFCIFQLHQTYHGVDPRLNIGAKGLSGEGYLGMTFWDTETYCLPFYMFNNRRAARNLLGYRYSTLPQAVERAGQLDCSGARYPMCTIDGTESCGVWQHGDLEIHVPAAVSYGIWHYVHVTGDRDFLYRDGIEMLLQVSRYFASRGDWSPRTGEFGFWGVMGPDEFCMMVHNNVYTNLLAQKTFQWTLDTMAEMKKKAPALLAKVLRKVNLKGEEPKNWRRMIRGMRINYDPKTGLFEQHDGYFDLPHVDVKSIPVTDFPIYKNWAYVRIFRNDMIKQPDVLLFLFFFSQDYSLRVKRVNYDYYEPRCSHESSLSPGIHSIMAAELGKHEDAYHYSLHASRLDLDDYNRNTWDGLHTTSMAAAWMNVVYGFGGMRSDGDLLVFNPSIPAKWKSFSFRVLYRDSILSVAVDKGSVALKTTRGPAVPVKVFGRRLMVGASGKTVELPADRRG